MFGIQTHQEHLGQNFFISPFKGIFFQIKGPGDEIKKNIKVNW